MTREKKVSNMAVIYAQKNPNMFFSIMAVVLMYIRERERGSESEDEWVRETDMKVSLVYSKLICGLKNYVKVI